MKLAYSPEHEALRQELRAYYQKLLTPEIQTGTGSAQGNAMSTNEVSARFLDTYTTDVNGDTISFDPTVFPDDADRVGQHLEADAFFFCVVDFLGPGREFLFAAAIDYRRLFCAQAQSRPH